MRVTFKLQPALRRVSLAVLATASAGYLGLLALYVLPDNPLRVATWPLARSVVGRFFDQRWGMFAPSPLSVARTLCVRCEAGDTASSWVDATSPLTERVRAQVVSSDLDLATYFMNMIGREISFRARTSSTTVALEGELPKAGAAREDLDLRWARIGSLVCQDVFDQPFAHVRLKYREAPDPRWTSRYETAPPSPDGPRYRDHLLGPFPAATDIDAPGLFTAEPGACAP